MHSEAGADQLLLLRLAFSPTVLARRSAPGHLRLSGPAPPREVAVRLPQVPERRRLAHDGRLLPCHRLREHST